MQKLGVEELRKAWEALAADPVALAKNLLDLATHADSDIVRVRAARAVLDRVGLRRGVDVGLSAAALVDIRPARPERPAVDVIIERLAALHASKEEASHASHMKDTAL
ncbi:hypothetical protein H5398_03280 [Tessaracoccus sp. MC1679]|uniref:hypothetical protein n=1 Tax=Tessaracoccus sp. MC1679 TaxID=2760313 RepID=UPI00160454F2|nr:hypothetical protein [Tessaracoccus sp. MC1679]MBB1515002.1 hypothetical protein [Tessaracoccus sp. MC1679]